MDLLFDVLKYMFGSWQLGLAALLFLLLFPIVFILASLKPKIIRKKRKPAESVTKKTKKRIVSSAKPSVIKKPKRMPSQEIITDDPDDYEEDNTDSEDDALPDEYDEEKI